MTGAQDAEGALTVAQLTHKLTAEGVKQIIICADEPKRHDKRALAKGTVVWHRDRLDEAQKRLRDVKGVTVLIYDQHCAADARRQRKRGTLPTRTTRVIINEAVCEGCGDCGVKSNCLSVQPVDTEFGRKTRIDQTSCNTDYSCLDGDCPSFVTVEVRPGQEAAHAVGARASGAARPRRRAGHLHAQRLLRRHRRYRHRHGEPGARHRGAARRLRRGEPRPDRAEPEGRARRVAPAIRRRQARSRPTGSPPAAPTASWPSICWPPPTPRTSATATPPRRSPSCRPARRRPVTWSTTRRSPIPRPPYLLNRLGQVSRTVHSFDALAAAQNLFGNTAAANFLLIGAAYQTGALRLPADVDRRGHRNQRRRRQGQHRRLPLGTRRHRRPGPLRRRGVTRARPAAGTAACARPRGRHVLRRRSATSSHDGLRTSFSSRARRSRADT